MGDWVLGGVGVAHGLKPYFPDYSHSAPSRRPTGGAGEVGWTCLREGIKGDSAGPESKLS